MPQSPLARVQFVRASLIDSLAAAAMGLSADPEPTPPRTVPKALEALDLALDGYLAMVKATHTSSHEMYAERDLPEDESEHLRTARHHLRLLHALYDPRPATPSTPVHHVRPAASHCADMAPRFPIPQREQDDARQAEDGTRR